MAILSGKALGVDLTMIFENQLRRAVDLRRHHLIEHLKALSVEEDTPLEQLTLSDLEREWQYYLSVDLDQDQAN